MANHCDVFDGYEGGPLLRTAPIDVAAVARQRQNSFIVIMWRVSPEPLHLSVLPLWVSPPNVPNLLVLVVEETGAPGGNPLEHGENKQTPNRGPGPARSQIQDCYEATVLTTNPLCRPLCVCVCTTYRRSVLEVFGCVLEALDGGKASHYHFH